MIEQMERALRACAEHRVPDTADPWPAIRERALDRQRRPSLRVRLVPRTRIGWVFVVLVMMLFGTAGFAATGWVDELFRYTAPEIGEANLGVPVNEEQTVDGVTFTLERAYADEDNVVVGYSVDGFDNRPAYYPTSGMPVITNESDNVFKYVGGLGTVTDPSDKSVEEGSESELAFFEPSKRLQASGEHRFQLELNYIPDSGNGDRLVDAQEKPAAKTLTFDFSIPVRKLDVIQVGQTVEANGVSMTLERVENSPARTEAILCFEPPRDEKYTWVPVIERPNIAESDVFTNELLYYTKPEAAVGCVGYDLFRSLYDQPGTHSFVVTRIEGRVPTTRNPEILKLEEKISGPWTFEFEVPER